MLTRSGIRAISNFSKIGARHFCDNKKPPKGFEKFYKKKEKSKTEDKDPEPEKPDQEPEKKSSWFSDFNTDFSRFGGGGSGGGGKYPNYLWMFPLMGLGAYAAYKSVPEEEIPEITF